MMLGSNWSAFHDLLTLAIDRADHANQLWVFYSTIVGAAFGIAKFATKWVGPRASWYALALPLIFLACAVSNLNGIFRLEVQREALIMAAKSVAHGDAGATQLLAPFEPWPSKWGVLTFHLAVDLSLALFLFKVSHGSDSEPGDP
jgi:hypothetical protein